MVLRRPHTALLQATMPGNPAKRGAYTSSFAAAISKSLGDSDLEQIHKEAAVKMKLLDGCQHQNASIQSTLQKYLYLPWNTLKALKD